MPSKESLERGRKYNESVHACSCRAIPHNTEMQNFCLSCIALADLLDEAIRAEAEWWARRSPRMLGTHWQGCEKEHAECDRLAQLREGKT